MKRRGALIIAAFAMLVCSSSLAQTPSSDARAQAKEAYDRGIEAHGRGDLQRAAEEFARADALAPSPVALQAALDAAIDADDPALGAELLQRSQRAKASGPLAASIQAARSKFAKRAGRVRVQCPEGTTCNATLDGAAIDVTKPTWTRTGQHTVVVQVDGDVQTSLVRVEPGQTVDVEAASATAPRSSETTPPFDDADRSGDRRGLRNGLPPIFFYGGLGATILLGAATAYFALDTKNKHDEFETLGCARANLTNCQDLKDDGQAAQTATNVGLALTGVVGVATAVVGLAFTDWKAPLVAVTPGGATVAIRRRF